MQICPFGQSTLDAQEFDDDTLLERGTQTTHGAVLIGLHTSPCALQAVLPSAVTHSVPSHVADGREEADDERCDEDLLLVLDDDDLADENVLLDECDDDMELRDELDEEVTTLQSLVHLPSLPLFAPSSHFSAIP